MIQLKLAEYKNEKFKEFLELGLFGYYGDSICVHELKTKDNSKKLTSESFSFELEEVINDYELDKKDPLNRFGGLFDGRTYGGGRFVLISWCGQQWEDSIYTSGMESYSFGEAAILRGGQEECSFKTKDTTYMWDDAAEIFTLYECEGNLHENPKLYEKIK